MKKIICRLLAALMIVLTLAACGGDSTGSASVKNEPESKKLNIACTIFPLYDWAKNLAGDAAEVTLLLDSGVDLHSYQATVDDIITISDCDVFIYVGGESDSWVKDVLNEAVNDSMTVIDALDVLGDAAKEEELIDGMQSKDGEETHNHDDEEETAEYDEHVWLSVKNAEVLCEYIGAKLAELDPENAQSYEANTADYIEKLSALDAEYREAIDAAAQKIMLFADRFPFRYLADDYGLTYYAAFPGCSAETEASFETVAFLADKIDELGLKSVFTIEGRAHKIAETVVASTKDKDQIIYTLNSMQAVTADAVKDGASYISIMQDNLNVLREAL